MLHTYCECLCSTNGFLGTVRAEMSAFCGIQSLPCAQDLVVATGPEPAECSPYYALTFSKIHCNTVFAAMSSAWDERPGPSLLVLLITDSDEGLCHEEGDSYQDVGTVNG